MKYDDTDYIVNREESIEYKEKIEENNAKYTKQELKQAIIDVDLLIRKYFKDNVTYKKALGIAKDCMEEVMQQLDQKDKRIKELEEENKTILNSKIGVDLSYDDYIPKQKIKEILIEIQEEFNKLDKETDKQIKDKNKDYYKCKENIAIMQTLAYCRDKFKELLEEK